jgi:hypothetical protein
MTDAGIQRENGRSNGALERHCQAKNRAGQPCRSPVVGDDGLCVVHSGRLDMREVGRAGGIASAEVRLRRAKHVRERLQQKVERHFEDVWAVFERALKSENEAVQLKAAMGLLAEAYGNPATALIGDSDKPLTFVLESSFAKAESERRELESAA